MQWKVYYCFCRNLCQMIRDIKTNITQPLLHCVFVAPNQISKDNDRVYFFFASVELKNLINVYQHKPGSSLSSIRDSKSRSPRLPKRSELIMFLVSDTRALLITLLSLSVRLSEFSPFMDLCLILVVFSCWFAEKTKWGQWRIFYISARDNIFTGLFAQIPNRL